MFWIELRRVTHRQFLRQEFWGLHGSQALFSFWNENNPWWGWGRGWWWGAVKSNPIHGTKWETGSPPAKRAFKFTGSQCIKQGFRTWILGLSAHTGKKIFATNFNCFFFFFFFFFFTWWWWWWFLHRLPRIICFPGRSWNLFFLSIKNCKQNKMP